MNSEMDSEVARRVMAKDPAARQGTNKYLPYVPLKA